MKTVGVSWIIGDARIATKPADEACQHEAEPGEEVGRVTEQHGALLVLGGRSHNQPEPAVTRVRPQSDGDQDHDQREPEPVARDRQVVGDRDRLARQDLPDPDVLLVGESPVDQRREDDDEPDAGDDLCQRRRLRQRPEHEEVDEQAHQAGGEHRQRHRPPEPDVVAEVVAARKPWDRERVGPVPEVRVDVDHPHRHRAVREVDDAGPLERDHQAEAQRRDDRPCAAAEQEVERVVGHRRGPIVSAPGRAAPGPERPARRSRIGVTAGSRMPRPLRGPERSRRRPPPGTRRRGT